MRGTAPIRKNSAVEAFANAVQQAEASPQYSPHSPYPHGFGFSDVDVEEEPPEESFGDFQARMQASLHDTRKQVRDLRYQEHQALEAKATSDNSWRDARDAVEQYSASLQVLPNLVSDFMQGAMYIYKEDCCFADAKLEGVLSHEIKRKRADARDCMERENEKDRNGDVKLRKLEIEIALADAHVAVLQRML